MRRRPPGIISLDTAKDILSKLKSDSIPVTVWCVFPEAECRHDGFIFGNNKDALLVRTRLNDDSGPFMAAWLTKKGVRRCVHYRFRSKSKPFRGLGENILGFFFSNGSRVHVFYNTKLPQPEADSRKLALGALEIFSVVCGALR